MEPVSGLNPQTGKTDRRKLPSWVAPTLGYVVAAASLFWVFHGVDLKRVAHDFTSIDWRYVTAAVILDLSVYLCHGWRWKVLLTPVARVPFWRAVQAVYIGLFANEILPLRTGEVIRCYLLAHWTRFPVSIAISSAAVERVVDGIWLVVAFLITTAFVPLPKYLVDAAWILGGGVLVAAGILAVIIFHKHHAHSVVRQSKWGEMLKHVVEGLHEMGREKTLIGSAAISLLYLILQIVPVWALMQGYGQDLSIWAASAVLVILRLGTVIPNAPGNVGSFQFFCVVSLGLFGIDKTTAVGFSFVVWSVLTLPLLLGGFLAVLLTGLNFQEIRRRAHASLHHAKPPVLKSE